MKLSDYILENDKLLVGGDYMAATVAIFFSKTFTDLIDNDM